MNWFRNKRQKKEGPSTGLSVSTLAGLNRVMSEDVGERRKSLDKMKLQDWQIHPSSKDNTMTLVNHKSKHTLSIHAATNLQKRAKEDLLTDSYIVGDLLHISPRYKDALDNQKKVMDEFKDYTHSTTGFSLGGAIANQLGHHVNIESHAFNPGVSPKVFPRQLSKDGLIQKALRKLRPKKETEAEQHLYLTKGDWISNSGIFGIHGDEEIHFNNTKPDASSAGGPAHDIGNWIDE